MQDETNTPSMLPLNLCDLANYPYDMQSNGFDKLLEEADSGPFSDPLVKLLRKSGLGVPEPLVTGYSLLLNCPVIKESIYVRRMEEESGLSIREAMELSREYLSLQPFKRNTAWLFQEYGEYFLKAWADDNFVSKLVETNPIIPRKFLEIPIWKTDLTQSSNL